MGYDTVNRYGICYSLEVTPFVFRWRGDEYRFTSQKHLNSFKEDVRVREEWFKDSLSRRFKCTIDIPLIPDIQTYCRCETRGFYVVLGGVVFRDPKDIVITKPEVIRGGVETDA